MPSFRHEVQHTGIDNIVPAILSYLEQLMFGSEAVNTLLTPSYKQFALLQNGKSNGNWKMGRHTLARKEEGKRDPC